MLTAAKQLAQREQRTLGAVITSLARQGLLRATRGARTERNGIPLLPQRKGATPVTLELIKQLRDEGP